MLLDTIFHNLLYNEPFFNKVYPFLKPELFEDVYYQILFEQIQKYSNLYSKRPNEKDLKLLLDTDREITEERTEEVVNVLKRIEKTESSDNLDFLVDETEKWVKDRVMELAILESVEILQDPKKPRTAIEQKIKDALSVSFSNDLGLEYLDDSETQYKFYTDDELGIPVDVPTINEAVTNGFRKKATYIFIGKTHIGKTLWLCHLAASFKKDGYNGVYFTAEMSENAIGKRIDANILNMEMHSLGKGLDKETYLSNVKAALKKWQKGKWFIKEYPPGYASKTNLTNYLQELSLKKGIKPDVIIVDYINIFASARLPFSASLDSYRYMKAVTEEFRALGVEEKVPIITATQLNREFANKDADAMDSTGTGDSWAIPQTADWMGAIIQPEELYAEGKYLLKILKNRFDENLYEVYTLGVDRSHMRLLDLAKSEQNIPIVVRDRMDHNDLKRQAASSNDENIFLFADDF